MAYPYQIKSFDEYKAAYKKSIESPEEFWAEVAENFVWKKKWDKVLEWNFTEPKVEWFKGAKLNITENCIDRHLKKLGDKPAIIWEPNNPEERVRTVTYNRLHKRVCQFAQVLKNNGVKKGDRVIIYMGMVPELAYAVLGCARIGAIHSVVFGGFSAQSIADRLEDAGAEYIVTCDGAYRGEKVIPLKSVIDDALIGNKTVKRVIVYTRTRTPVSMIKGRDVWWEDEMEYAESEAPLPPRGGVANTQPSLEEDTDLLLAEEYFDYQTSDPFSYGLLKEFVKKHRSMPTLAESSLWEGLRGKQLEGHKFRRQHIIGNYIADFVCLQRKLVVEVDGLIHQLPENKESDDQRTRWLHQHGYEVVRFSNDEVINETKKVLSEILLHLKKLTANNAAPQSEVSAMDNPPSGGRGAVMDAEDPLFILYTSGSTGKPKGVVHSVAGYMIWTAYTFVNVFQYQPGDVFFCTADIGWITGHSYIVYGPLAAGATSLMFEGIPTWPDAGRFWDIIDKHKVNILYTAPTAIRSLMGFGLKPFEGKDLSSLKVLGTVGEPINEEAWHWYDEHVGKGKCPIVDTWWQTETGATLLSNLAGITPSKPGWATLPMPGVQPVLVDEAPLPPKGGASDTQPRPPQAPPKAGFSQPQPTLYEETDDNTDTPQGEVSAMDTPPLGGRGALCIKAPWPSIIRTTYGDHERCRQTYFSTYPGLYFTGDGALRDEEGNYRITGRVDDVLNVSGHRIGTAEVENAINMHAGVIESAVVGYPHDIKGQGIYAYVIFQGTHGDESLTRKDILQTVSRIIGAIAKPDKIQFVSGLPKTRSGKIMRRILRKIAEGETENFGDITTLLDPSVVNEIAKGKL